MSRLGVTALDGMAKTKESDKVLQGKNWCTLARFVGLTGGAGGLVYFFTAWQYEKSSIVILSTQWGVKTF